MLRRSIEEKQRRFLENGQGKNRGEGEMLFH